MISKVLSRTVAETMFVFLSQASFGLRVLPLPASVSVYVNPEVLA